MPRVIDSHAHIFPFLGGASGFPTVQEHRVYAQWAVRHHVQPVRRVRDNSVVTAQTLIREPEVGFSSLTDVNFHVGAYGRFVWAVDGEEYGLQYMPPSLQDMTAPAELLLALMDYAGVDVAVLQNDAIYGRLNSEFADAVARWPDRFIGLAQVDPDPTPEVTQCARLRDAVERFGLRGLFFKIDDFADRDFTVDPFGPAYQPLWELVTALGIPVLWHLAGGPVPSLASFLAGWERFASWLDRYSTVPCVMVGGLPLDLLSGAGLPSFMRRAVRDHAVWLEILFPIAKGGEWRYPYSEGQAAVKLLYEEFGPTKLVWGSDIPNIERYCTYRQSRDYLETYPFLSNDDRELILGGNMERIFHLDE